MKLFEGKVVDQNFAEDYVKVAYLNGVILPHRIKMGRKRATPLYGESGNLPDLGETGLVAISEESYLLGYWICSVHSFIQNMCINEKGQIREFLENGIQKIIKDNGDMELYHPSGTRVNIGTSKIETVPSRYKKKDTDIIKKEVVTYERLKQASGYIYLKHDYGSGSGSSTYKTDKRKTDSGTKSYSTELELDPTGNVKILHHTSGGDVTMGLDSSGNITWTTLKNHSVTAGEKSEITSPIQTITASSHQDIISDEINLGAATANRDLLKRLINDTFIQLFNTHVHKDVSIGTDLSGVPNVLMSTDNATDTVRAK
jgi:hypothetical protein